MRLVCFWEIDKTVGRITLNFLFLNRVYGHGFKRVNFPVFL